MKKIAEKIKLYADLFKKELQIYRLVMKDTRTPFAAKMLLWLAIGYLMLPFDIIPDFIPVIGQIDDLIIVPVLVFFALKMIPEGVVNYHRSRVK